MSFNFNNNLFWGEKYVCTDQGVLIKMNVSGINDSTNTMRTHQTTSICQTLFPDFGTQL